MSIGLRKLWAICVMDYHNTRFPQMWDVISSKIDFTNKIIIDVGCGWGDFAFTVAQQAKMVYAFDIDFDICAAITAKYSKQENLIICQDDINDWSNKWYPKMNGKSKVDYLSCFSVLPYLDDPTKILQLFRQISEVVLIECQYNNDGPGFEGIKDDGDMFKWLKLCGYGKVDRLGETLVEDRDKYRTLWRCE